MKQDNDFYVVGIGASAGGLDAVQQLFNNIPGNTGVAYVIIQHLSPDFISLMPELLAKHTSMQIFTAEDNQEIQPNCIYLNQRRKNIGIKNNRFILLDKAPKDHLNLPIDILFHMLGESYKDKAVGIILSGTGSDGSRGIKTIKEAGGIILVQEPTSAQFDGMPNSAIMTNLPDFILPPAELAEKIVQYTGKRLHLEGDGDLNTKNEKTFQAILTEVQKYAGVNFKKYKINTLLRRLEKRMSLHNIDTLDVYLSFLRENDKERAAINQEFLIGVTSFFRDKEAFNLIKNKIVPAICQQKNKHDTVRIWISGCSSGEEVYSIAMLFEDHIRNLKLGLDYKIFATDIDKRALHQASLGSYSVNNCAEIDKKFLEEYFLKSGDKIQIIKRIREKIVFSYHDVTKDPPFIKVDLISCRNLLIYFSNNTQKTVLSGFQFSLNKDGFLFLGNSESLGTISNLFKVIDTKFKVFQNLYENKRLSRGVEADENLYNISAGTAQYLINQPQQIVPSRKQNELFYYKYLSKKHAPVTVFVDKEFNVQFILGEFKKWFNQTDGVFSNNLLSLVTPELATIIRNGIRRVVDSKKSVSIKNLICKTGEDEILTDLFFEIIEDTESHKDIYMVQFGIGNSNSSEELILLSNDDVSNFSKQRIEDLELEVKESKAELQNVVEELETSNEELQSSNEELMSSNEELQSANEELQSVNEELYTVNTEFQDKNRELESLNNDINNLLNSTDIGTLFLDVDLNIRKFTPAVKRIFNLEETDIGRSLSSFASEFPETTRKSIITDSKTALENLRSFEKEIRDSKGNWYLKRISPFITADKKIEGVVITFVDINKLKKANSELNETELKLSTALEAGNMAWWEMRLPSGEVVFNRNKAEMLGRKPEDFKHYTDFIALVHPDDSETAMEAMRNHLEGQAETYECQYRIKNISGNYQWFQDVGKITYRSENEIIVSGIVLEITAKKQTEMLLMETIKKAEAATKAKSEFLANMSHEIRTPLNGVIGFTELLKETPLSQVQQQYVNNANVSGHTLLAIINDILDFSKIEAGMLNLEMINVDMVELLESVVDVVKFSADKKNLELLLHLDPEMPRYAVADPIRLQQILANLLGNAIKFTEKGEVELKVNYEPLSDRRGKFSFFVRDTGIGITEEQKGKLFKAFSQADSSTTRKFGGTGLGLIISDLIAQIMGSKIHIDSEPGEGATFYFDIVTDVEKGEKLDKCSMDKIKRCLIIDDNANNRLILEKMLVSWGIAYESSDNGLSALKLLETSKPFDIIICDYNMPYIDGLETIRMIQENLKLSPEKQPVILLHSSSDKAELHQKCEELGIRFRLTKPVKSNDLHTYLCQFYGPEPKDFKPANSEFYLSDLYSNNIRILIAEDVAMNMIMMKAVIGNILPSARLMEASSGSEVLKLIKQEMPDLIFMDVNMPSMDGLDATREIRKIEQSIGAHIPIIALTAGAFKEEQENCLSAGMDDFLAKPVEPGKIRTVLAKYFVKKPENIVNVKFSKDSLLKKLNGNTVVLTELLSVAVTDLSKHICSATEAFEKKDIDGIRSIVHGIKGLASNLDCFFVVDLAIEIEGLAASGGDLLKLAPKFKELLSSLKILKDLLAE